MGIWNKLFPGKPSHKPVKKREEKKLFARTRVIVLSDFFERFNRSGEKERVSKQWDVGETVETVTYCEGEEASVKVRVQLLKLPDPILLYRRSNWEEWQANDFPIILTPDVESFLFRDRRMLMRLDARSQFLWTMGEEIIVPYRDLIDQANYIEWMKLMMLYWEIETK